MNSVDTASGKSGHQTVVVLAAFFLLLGDLLIGLAQTALLPPMEGFDETAHLSYIQQLALTGHWPGHGAPLSREVEDYATVAPTPYASVPPYDDNGHWTYHRFFTASGTVIEAGRSRIKGVRTAPEEWPPGRAANWEAQHPPFYYFLLAPVSRWTADWSLAGSLFLMRALSYGMGWAGLCVASLSAWRCHRGGGIPWAALAPALWPLAFPMWFPEMARLGNDSAVCFLAALVLAILAGGGGVRADRSGLRAAMTPGRSLVAGGLLGLGLLVKATLFPMLAAVLLAVAAALLFRHPDPGRDPAPVWRRLLPVVLMGGAAVVVGGGWYAAKYLETSSALGANDMIALAEGGGLVKGLAERASPVLFLRGCLNIVQSFLWAGTWSFVQPPSLTLVPFLLIAISCVFAHGVGLIRTPSLAGWIGALTALLFAVGLVYHLAVFIAAYGVAGTPGWYLHGLAPVLATALASLLAAAAGRPLFARPLGALLLCPLVFLPGVAALEAVTYSGCVPKMASLNYPDLARAEACMTDIGVVVARLDLLASPRPAAILFLSGLAASMAGLALLIRLLSKPVPPLPGGAGSRMSCGDPGMPNV